MRRQQIVETTLALLADSPLDQLSTRQIAKGLGISQPALFRHFASRDALLLSVIDDSTERLGTLVHAVVQSQGSALDKLSALGAELLRHLAAHPGLPRLLFANVAAGAGPIFDALRRLYSMQSSLVTELIREGQRAGEIEPAIDARDAASLFVGALQSATLLRRLEARSEPLESQGRRLLAIWQRGVRATTNTSSPVMKAPPRAVADTPAHADGLRGLDVRPLLASGVDPLEKILQTVDEVGPSGVVKITAPFRPAPLIALLAGRGHAVREQQLGPREFTLEVIVGGAPEPEELRDLEPPEPLERVLVQAGALAPGGVYLARLPRHPRLLLPRLAERGLAHQVFDEPDGTALIRVYRSR